jgi:hypothetical protein
MVLTIDDSLLLLGRYKAIPVCAVLVSRSGSGRIRSTLQVLKIRGLWHVRIGKEGEETTASSFAYRDAGSPIAIYANRKLLRRLRLHTVGRVPCWSNRRLEIFSAYTNALLSGAMRTTRNE